MILLGEAIVTGTHVNITAPAGWATVRALRLTNYTSDVLVLTNISGVDQSQEYLLPLQQMVYRSINSSNIPTVEGISLGALTTVPTVLVEWSTEPLVDFIGTYPTAIGVGSATPLFTNGRLSMPVVDTTYILPGNPFRKSITFINDSVIQTLHNSDIQWSYMDGDNVFWSTVPHVLVNTGRTIESTATIYFRSLDNSISLGSNGVEWYQETYA